MLSPNHCVSQSKDIACRTINEETFIISPEGEMLFHLLNPTGTRVWELLDGRSIEEVVSTIYEEFDVDRENALEDVVAFITELADKELVVISV